MTAGGRRIVDETARLKDELRREIEDTDDLGEGHDAQKRRRPWKDDHRRQDRQSKKQRQRNPEWND